MPTRYILEASHTIHIKVIINITIDTSNCHIGTPPSPIPPGNRMSITMGDVKGNKEKPTAMGPCGLLNTEKKPT
jgi:hypothetical protein